MVKNILPVSIIIASYNSSHYIEDCVKSINSGNSIPSQIIIIDDCSTDNSFNIANILQKSHPNLKLYKTNVNSGAAQARLLGFKNATEEFVAIVDADDYLDANAISDAYKKITQFDADLCIWKLWRVNKAGKKWLDQANPIELPLNGSQAVLMTLGSWRIHCAGIAKKSLFLKAYHELENSGFTITDSYNSDELITRLLLSSVNRIVTSEAGYFYRVNENSTTLKLSKKHLFKLRSELWLIRFARTFDNPPMHILFRSLMQCAWFIHSNHDFLGSESVEIELNNFLFFSSRQHDFLQFLHDNPEFFYAYFIIYNHYKRRK